MNSRIDDKSVDMLLSGILCLDDMKECSNFFFDLCTIPEIKAMAQRFVVAKMLKDGSVYSDIVEKTGASTATISRVNRSLLYGNDGYTAVFDRLDEKK